MRFEFADKAPLVVVEARLNNKGPFKFIVDTASSVTVVGREAAEVLGIHQNSNSAISGSPFMKDYQVVIDYPRREIAFEESGQERRLPTKIRLVSDANFVVVETELNEKGPFNFLVDTGATKTVVTKQIGQIFGLGRTSYGEKKALSGSFAGTTMILSKVKSVQVGKAKSTDVEVGVQDLQYLCDGVGVTLDGVLGYTFMKDYRVTINYPKREMSFEREDESEIDGVSKEVKR